ncbi:MAG: preprotein translocase subunit SecG [Fibrobacterota bacterium]
MFYGILLGVLVFVSLFLVLFVLMQSDKGGGLAGTFGGIGWGGLPFSGREAATILTKLTTGLAVAFMVICIVLNLMSRNRAHTSTNSALQKRAEKLRSVESQSASSVLDQAPLQQQAAPALPAAEGNVASPLIPEPGEAAKVNIPGVTQPAKPAGK